MSLFLVALAHLVAGRVDARRDQRGQATAEYALVLLGAAAVALALVTWVGNGKVSAFFDAIFSHLMASAK